MHMENRGILFHFVLCFFLLATLMGCKSKEPVQITFSFGPDNAGTMQSLIDEFNKANKGEIVVQFKEGSRLSNEYFDQLATDFSIENYEVDVWGSDVVWTQTMVAKGWAENLSQRFFQTYNPDEFVDAAVSSATYQSSVWAMPWYTDVGVLFYRKDLLAAQGYDLPPMVWSDLYTMAQKVMKAHPELSYGYLFQADAYEGGVVNACEFIWNAGGDLMLGDFSIEPGAAAEPNIVTVNSEETKNGLALARKVFEEGLSKAEAQKFREQECAKAFFEGKALFMRGWPTSLGQYDEAKHVVKMKDIGLAPLPVSKSGIDSKSCLGGWNLMINTHAGEAEKEAAWRFILYLVSPEAQKFRAEKEGALPSLKALYQDQELIGKSPIVGFAGPLINNSKNRPNSPYYMEMSPFISTTFHKVVKGELSVDEAVAELENRLNTIMQTAANL